MSETRSLPSTLFDHLVWGVQSSDGAFRRAEISLGECLLLFTSMDSVHSYLDGCEDREEQGLRPVVFSRGRKEFGRSARRVARAGIVGALFDPCPDAGEAPFLPFARTAR
jgi:hypothetical protein